MSIRTFVWPELIQFSYGYVKGYGVWIDIPWILPLESTLELPTPKSLEYEYGVIDVTISNYRLDVSGVLIMWTNSVLFTSSTPPEVMPGLIQMGWLNVLQVWPSPLKEFTPPTFERADKDA